MFWQMDPDSVKYASFLLLDRTAFVGSAQITDVELNLKVWHGQPSPMKSLWRPIKVAFGEDPKAPLRSNCPGIGTVVHAWDRHAIEVLGPLVEPYVEFLPLACDEGEYWAMNVLAVVDCLDHDQSEFDYFADGNIKRVRRYHFQPGCLEGRVIFRMPEHYSRVFVSDEVKRVYDASDLTGLKFTPRFE